MLQLFNNETVSTISLPKASAECESFTSSKRLRKAALCNSHDTLREYQSWLMLSHRAKVVLRPAYAPAPLQSCCLSTFSQPWFRSCALWKHCLLANASMFLGLRHVMVLLLCNLATLQCYSCSTTKRCRPSPFQRRAQNVNHPRHRCDFGK